MTSPAEMPLDDIDAILAALIQMEDGHQPLTGADAVAARAIIALSRAGHESGQRALQQEARRLMAQLSIIRQERRGVPREQLR